MNNKIVKEIVSWTRMIVISFAIILLLNSFVLQAYRVQGQSMEPTLENNDFTVLLKTDNNYEYGDIVILDSRINHERTLTDEVMENVNKFIGKSPDYLWVKRIIGKPNDQIEFIDGQIYRNGKVISEPYIKEMMFSKFNTSYTVPEGHWFVLGDNRNYSKDSRYIGPIPDSNIVGTVLFK